MADALIELRGAHFAYPARPTLFEGLDFLVRPAECVGLIGPNGSGKSTLLRMLIGLISPTAGSLSAFGAPVESSDDLATLRRRVGFLFQDTQDQLFCPLVRDDVAFGPLNLGWSPDTVEREVDAVLSRVGLQDCAGRPGRELSGGQQRMVALATVLVLRPEVLLLDEPTAGLDPRGKRNLAAQLMELSDRRTSGERKGAAVAQVVASHDMEFVRRVCGRVVVLCDGRIEADGDTDVILGDSSLMERCGLEVPGSLSAGKAR